DLDPAGVRESDVEDGDVRPHRGQETQGLGGAGRFTDQHEVVVLLDQPAQPDPYELVVIEDEHAHHAVTLGDGGASAPPRGMGLSTRVLAGPERRVRPCRRAEASPYAPDKARKPRRSPLVHRS